MSGVEHERTPGTVGDRLLSVVRGQTDARPRATWRVLLAWPLLWIVTGGLLAGNVQSAVAVIPDGPEPGGGLAQSLLHAAFFAILLVPWARYVDRQPLSSYGVSATPRWLLDALAGVAAVVLGFGAWAAFGALLGVTTVTAPLSLPEGSLLVTLAIPVVALVLHAAVQQVVFFRVILKNAAEGLHSRGATPTAAAIGALPVAVLVFVAMHEFVFGLRILDLAVAGGIFGLLYLQTGDLALGTGAHFGALYVGNVLFRSAGSAADGLIVFEVSGSLPGVLGTINQYGFPKMVVAYLVLLAWLWWRRGDVSIRSEVVERAGRAASEGH